MVKRFLRGAAHLRLPVVHRFLFWDLSMVLLALVNDPFESLRIVSLQFVTLKVTFLVAITSTWRISELGAASVRGDLCAFHPNTVMLRLDSTFIPKINSYFHRAQEIVLLYFCPNPSHDREKS